MEILFDLLNKEKRISKLKEELTKEAVWKDINKSAVISKELSGLEEQITSFNNLKNKLEDLECLVELYIEEGVINQEISNEVSSAYTKLVKNVENKKIEVLLSDKYDSSDAVLQIQAGAGGTEAQDWASMLYRMYTRYAESRGFKLTLNDILDGEEAGIKNLTLTISGMNAYGYFKCEHGVHRLVRISPFDSNGRRHTSFASVEVSPLIQNTETIKINEDDLRIDRYRSSGAGGQHVNKTESAVRITHIPTGIVAQCQNERSQIQNRERAMAILIGRLLELREREELKKKNELIGELKKIEWGSQIRSYVFCPYTMVKDHRTLHETGDVEAVMNGEIDDFIFEYLKKSKGKKNV